jgi:hypothetical protein
MIWYAWIPGQFFLPATPSNPTAPTGWTAAVSGNSVQYVASSSSFDITAGTSLSGFGYQATFSPSTLAATPNSGESDAYHAGLFSDGGSIFTVQAVPEPSEMALLGAGALGLLVSMRRTLR